MQEGATPNVVQTNSNGNSTSIRKPTNPENRQQNNNGQGANDGKSIGKPPRQNYNNNSNNRQNNIAGKNPRKGKRFNRNKATGLGQSGSQQRQEGDGNRVAASGNSPNQAVRGTPLASNEKTWSRIVAPYPQNGYQEPQLVKPTEEIHNVPVSNDANKRQNSRLKKSGKKFDEKSNPSRGHVEETDFNADEKIEAIELQLDQTLNAMQTKTDRLKTLQEEIKTIKAERDGKIEELRNERNNLIEHLEKLKSELLDTENQISNINSTMAQLKTEKIQKIRSLEKQSLALLNDKAN
jgi:small-conductance mechanosensitive channel